MKNIFTYGEQPARRNLTVADLRACKGVRKLTQTNPATEEESAAAAEAGIDTLICLDSQYDAVRAGAPETFLTSALLITDYPTDEDTLRAAMKTMEAGADAIYTPRRPALVRMLADEGIPVMGHLGLVPRKCTWVGGLRAVGKTADEATILFDQFRRLEDAGAYAVEVEVVPGEVMAEISQRTSLITVSLGAGGHCDVTYLFARDILGDTEHSPRHAKVYGKLRKLRQEMQAERVRAMSAFVKEAHSGAFPTAKESVAMNPDELKRWKERLDAM